MTDASFTVDSIIDETCAGHVITTVMMATGMMQQMMQNLEGKPMTGTVHMPAGYYRIEMTITPSDEKPQPFTKIEILPAP